jgi:hypothetical protein
MQILSDSEEGSFSVSWSLDSWTEGRDQDADCIEGKRLWGSWAPQTTSSCAYENSVRMRNHRPDDGAVRLHRVDTDRALAPEPNC